MKATRCHNYKHHSSLSKDKSSQKKREREPLKCKKNIIGRTIQKTPKKYQKNSSVELDSSYKISQIMPLTSTPIRITSQLIPVLAIEKIEYKETYDVTPVVSRESRIKITRSSSGNSITKQSKQTTSTGGNNSNAKSKRKENMVSEMASQVSRTVRLKYLNKTSRSCPRHSIRLRSKEKTVTDGNASTQKRTRHENIDGKKSSQVSSTVPLESLKETARLSARHSVRLQSKEKTVIVGNVSKRQEVRLHSKKRTVTDGNVSTQKPKKQENLVSKNVSQVSPSVSLESPKETERSSARHSVRLQSKENTVIVGNVSKRQENKVGKRASQVPPIVPFESPNETARPSAKYSITLHSKKRTVTDGSVSTQKPKKQENLLSKNVSRVSPSVPLESPQETARSSGRHSVRLQMSIAQKTKHIRNSSASSQKQTTLQKTKHITRSSAQSQKQMSSVQKANNVRKSTATPRNHIRSKSCENIPVDFLTLACCEFDKQETKSDEETSDYMQVPTEKETNFAKKSTATSQKQTTIQRTKYVRKSVTTSRKQTSNLQKTKPVKSSTRYQTKTPNLQEKKRGRRSSARCQMKTPNLQNGRRSSPRYRRQRKCNSYAGRIPVDILTLSFNEFKKRKAKSDGCRYPVRGTLKRKRFAIEAKKRADADYEDDIYEEMSFDNFKAILPDSSESELSFAMSTPKFGIHVTPLIRKKTPQFKDCFSPREYALSRKVAEECMYRNKRRKVKSTAETPIVPEKKKLEFNEVLEVACRYQEAIERSQANSDEENSYFSDC